MLGIYMTPREYGIMEKKSKYINIVGFESQKDWSAKFF